MHLIRTIIASATLTCVALAFVPTFTGDVLADFPSINPAVLIVSDAAGDVVGGASGWDILDIRYAYDVATDTAYFGECCGGSFTPPSCCDASCLPILPQPSQAV